MSARLVRCAVRAGVFSATLLFSSVAAATASNAGISSGTWLEIANNHVEAGQFRRALTVLSSVEPTRENHVDVWFLVGLASVGEAQQTSDENTKTALLAQAVSAFRRILVTNPDLVRVRLELARTFFLQENDSLAREHFERVLAADPPEPVVANINRFLHEIKARRRWDASLGVQVVSDSNFNVEATDKTIWVNFQGVLLPFQSDSDPPKSGFGVQITGNAEYRAPVTDRLKLRFGVNSSNTVYPGSGSDRTVLTFFGGPKYALSQDHDVSLLAVTTVDAQKGSPSRRFGLRAEGGHSLGFRTHVRTHLGAYKRKYSRDTQSYLDANEYETGANLSFRISPTVTVNGGLTFSRGSPKGAPSSRRRTVGSDAGISTLLPNGFTVGFSGSLANTTYAGMPGGVPTRDGLPRSDSAKSLQATLLHRDFTLFGFSPELAVAHERLDTNAQAANYRRNRAWLNLVRQF